MQKNIIFLDVDGVLNSDLFFERYPTKELGEEYLDRLAKVYQEFDCQLVLASSWKNLREDNETYKSLVKALNEHGMEIYDKTPNVGGKRPAEIVEWLRKYKQENPGYTISFVSLDDDYDQADYSNVGIGDCLVKTNFYARYGEVGGLQDEHLDVIRRKFREHESAI